MSMPKGGSKLIRKLRRNRVRKLIIKINQKIMMKIIIKSIIYINQNLSTQLLFLIILC